MAKQPNQFLDSPQASTPVAADTTSGSKVETCRGLRLSSILIELGAQATDTSQNPANPSSDEERRHPPEHIDQTPDATVAEQPTWRHRKPQVRSNITIGEIVDRTERAGFGFTIALLALVAIPFAGLSTPFGLVIGFLGLQVIVGRRHPWLPRRVRQHAVTMKTLDWLGCRLARWTTWLERWVRPRWTVLIHPPLFAAVGVGVLLQGLGLALPLPIPGSNWVFIIPILIYAIGLLEDDGLLVLLGHASTVAMIVLGCIFWHVIRDNLMQAFAWLQRLV